MKKSECSEKVICILALVIGKMLLQQWKMELTKIKGARKQNSTKLNEKV